jgi:hypothetical protein
MADSVKWSHKVNLAGVTQFNEIVNLTPGPWKVRPISSAPHVSKDDAAKGSTSASSIWISCQTLDGIDPSQKGQIVEAMLGLATEGDAAGPALRAWQGLALSMGLAPEKAQGVMTFDSEKILSKDGQPRTLYFIVTEPPLKADGKLDYSKSYKNWITKEQYEQRMAALKAAGAPAAAAPAKAPRAAKAAPAPTPVETPAETAATPDDVEL